MPGRDPLDQDRGAEEYPCYHDDLDSDLAPQLLHGLCSTRFLLVNAQDTPHARDTQKERRRQRAACPAL
jgi:hypothetical protein